MAFGVDNTFASRPLDEGVFATYAADLPAGADEYVLDEGGDRLTPVDDGNVCVNVDTTWFGGEGIEPPQTLDDLVDPAYEDLFVTSGASTSSPGMAFLLSTIAEYGEDGWQDYWTDLLANGAKVVDGLVGRLLRRLHPGWRRGRAADRAVLRLVAGVHRRRTAARPRPRCSTPASARWSTPGCSTGAANPAGAEAVVDWLVSDEVQAALPTSMYVFPVSDAVERARRLGAVRRAARPSPTRWRPPTSPRTASSG